MSEKALFPAVGIRTWLVEEVDDQYFLKSVYHPETWFSGQPLHATCHAKAEHDSSPVLDCTCGIYLWRGDYFESHDFPISRNIDLVNVIHGEAFSWGHIVRHEYGWRAQYAQPASLLSLGNAAIRTTKTLRDRQSVLAKLSKVYGIPVVAPSFKVRKGCECPLCKIETRGFSEFDLSSILPPDESRSSRKAMKKRRR